mmetsp:Transcript_29346/g.53075  ORF Transcript_29346/g.53075 Transcript_29346/m.53075 type:complete len:153 (+) Transcript_29346:510-968(+)
MLSIEAFWLGIQSRVLLLSREKFYILTFSTYKLLLFMLYINRPVTVDDFANPMLTCPVIGIPYHFIPKAPKSQYADPLLDVKDGSCNGRSHAVKLACVLRQKFPKSTRHSRLFWQVVAVVRFRSSMVLRPTKSLPVDRSSSRANLGSQTGVN